MPRLILVLLLLVGFAAPALAVVGGRDATPGEIPSIVALVQRAKLPNAYEAQFCAGTLVAPDRVLTAAHCVFYPNGDPISPADMGVMAGFTTLSVSEAAPPTGVAAIAPHPEWNAIAKNGTDLAVIALSEPVTAVAPLSVAGPAQSLTWLAGRAATIVGWGAVLPDDGQTVQVYPQTLQVANSPFVADATCRLLQGSILPTVGAICVGDPRNRADTCSGDSGGPLIGTDPTSGAQLLVGAVSSGIGCNQPFHPGVYAMTAPMADWLRAQGVPVLDGPSPGVAPPRAKALPASVTPGRTGRLWWRSASRAAASEDIVIMSRSLGEVIAWKRTPLRSPRKGDRRKSVAIAIGKAYRNQRLQWCVVPTDDRTSGAASCARLNLTR